MIAELIVAAPIAIVVLTIREWHRERAEARRQRRKVRALNAAKNAPFDRWRSIAANIERLMRVAEECGGDSDRLRAEIEAIKAEERFELAPLGEHEKPVAPPRAIARRRRS